MSDFAIDPELRIRAKPEMVLRRTNDAVLFIREMVLSRRGHQWRSILQRFEEIRDELTAMDAVVNLELLLEAERLLRRSHLSLLLPLDNIVLRQRRSSSTAPCRPPMIRPGAEDWLLNALRHGPGASSDLRSVVHVAHAPMVHQNAIYRRASACISPNAA
jgi:hypothetical protein